MEIKNDTSTPFLDVLISRLLDGISPHIQFTMEIQNDNSIPFLDVLISHLLDGSLTYQVYRKKTY
jgi:hypothetical protein